jgi:hypothetical protein
MFKRGYAFPDAIDDNIVHLTNNGTNLFLYVTRDLYFHYQFLIRSRQEEYRFVTLE